MEKLIKSKKCEKCEHFTNWFGYGEMSTRYCCKLDGKNTEEFYEDGKCDYFKAKERQSIFGEKRLNKRIIEEL